MALSDEADASDVPDALKEAFAAAVSAQLRAAGRLAASLSPAISNLALYASKPGDPEGQLHWREDFLRYPRTKAEAQASSSFSAAGRYTAVLAVCDGARSPCLPHFPADKLLPLMGLRAGQSPWPEQAELDRRLQALAPAHFHSADFPRGSLILIPPHSPWYLPRAQAKTNRVFMIGKVDL